MKSIIYGDSVVTLTDSLYITAVSMFIVFSILIVICISLYLLRVVAPKKEEYKKEHPKKNSQVKNSGKINVESKTYQFENLKEKLDDENVRLATITACMDATEEWGHNNIKINYVREI